MRKKYLSTFRLVLSLLLAVVLTLSPVSVVHAENVTDNTYDAEDLIALFNKNIEEKFSKLFNGPVNLTGKLSCDTGNGSFPGIDSETLAVIKNIFVDLNCQISPEKMAGQTSLSVYNRDYPEQGLNVNTYNIGEKWILEMPNVLDQPLMLDLAKIAEKITSEPGFDSQIKSYEQIQKFIDSGEINKEVLAQAAEDFVNSLQKAADYFQDQGEKEQDFSLEGVRENLTVSSKVMSGMDLIHAARAFLTEIRNSQSLEKIYNAIVRLSGDANMPKTFFIALDPLIEQLYQLGEEDITDNEGVELHEYKDTEGKTRGYALRIFAQGSTFLSVDTYYLEDKSEKRGTRKPFIMKFDVYQEPGNRSAKVELLIDYSEKEGETLAPGSLTIYNLAYGAQEPILTLNFDYSEKEKSKQLEAKLSYPGVEYNRFETLGFLFNVTEDEAGLSSGSFELEQGKTTDGKTIKLLGGNFQNCEFVEIMPGMTGLFGKVELNIMSPVDDRIHHSLTLESVHKGNGEFNSYVQITPDKNLEDTYLKFLFDGKLSDQLSPEIPDTMPKDYLEFTSMEELSKIFEDPKIQHKLKTIGSYIVGQPLEQ